MRTIFFDYYRKARAFTLIELLVSVAIIGILAALLLTAFSSVKLKAQRTRCLSNVKQLALGSFMYASENSRHAGVETSAFPGGNWMGTLKGYASAKGILICPSAPLHVPPPATGNEQGYADRAWVRWTSDHKTMFSGSYGYNGYLYSDLKLSESGDPKQQQVFTRESAIQKPALTPVFSTRTGWICGPRKRTRLTTTSTLASHSAYRRTKWAVARLRDTAAAVHPVLRVIFLPATKCPERSTWDWSTAIRNW